KNKKISMDNIIYLIRNVGGSMDMLYNEINKLINYKKEEQITKQDIDTICTKSIESKVFELIDAIGNKKIEQAVGIYKNLIFNKIAPFMILSMIARQFRIILQVKYLDRQGKNIPSIANELGLRDFVVKQALAQSKYFTNKVLLEAINECLEIDNKAKTGIIQDELGVEMIIIKYSSIKF
ncbi:MAG: DNA polymerase III subunit delta, partial [Eubacteriales bacterium]|nr:DNA polymerase III subunit delta [Eubacteriales bacterium]